MATSSAALHALPHARHAHPFLLVPESPRGVIRMVGSAIGTRSTRFTAVARPFRPSARLAIAPAEDAVHETFASVWRAAVSTA